MLVRIGYYTRVLLAPATLFKLLEMRAWLQYAVADGRRGELPTAYCQLNFGTHLALY
jgi:hypothetical protein